MTQRTKEIEGDIIKDQDVIGEHVPRSAYDKRREAEMLRLKAKDIEEEISTEAFIEQEKNKGKTSGHIYYTLLLKKAKRVDEKEYNQRKAKCDKLLGDINDVVENTKTFEDMKNGLRGVYDAIYPSFRKERGFDSATFYDLEKCYGKQFYNLVGFRISSESAYKKQIEARQMDDTKEEDWEMLRKLTESKPKKAPVKGLKSEFNAEQDALFQKYADLEEKRFNFQGSDIANKIQNTFGLRAIQKGVSIVSEKEETRFLKLIYGSLYDLAKAANLETEDIGLGFGISRMPKDIDERERSLLLINNLAMAFGARGSGRAKAHYEPMDNIINITRNNGNGAIAHEWGHALDKRLGKGLSKNRSLDFSSFRRIQDFDDFASYQSTDPNWKPNVFLNDLDSLRKKIVRGDFCIGKQIPQKDRKYWSDPKECFARAFESYVDDSIAEDPNRFLVLPTKSDDPNSAYGKVYPQGEERKELNALFDKVFNEQSKMKKLITH